MATQKPTQKKFHGAQSQRSIPHHTERTSKYYPVTDEKTLKKARKTIKPTKYRDSLKPGQVLIILAGRFRGKRVILLKTLDQGVLLVTGPFKVNGVPLRRVNARYVLATATKIDVKGVDSKLLEKVSDSQYWECKEEKKKGEEAFFKQGDKVEKKEINPKRKEDQLSLDKTLLGEIKKQQHLREYLASSFSLRNGDRPHEMVF